MTAGDVMAWPDGQWWTAPLDCGHPPTPPTSFHSTGVPLTTGAGHDREGRTSCYPCATAAEAAQLADPEVVTFGAYIDSAGARLVSWPGGELGRVISHGYSRAGAWGGLHYWTVRTPDGRTWHGRNGGPGMCLTIRAHRRPVA